jgi:hypothetical protein
MKNLKRLVLGVLSSLLFAAGFANAADRLDPMSEDLRSVADQPAEVSAPDCTNLCDVYDKNV